MNQFEKDILEGLSKKQKTLPSKYFYDEAGDRLFIKIMEMPEYYLTDAEHEILCEQSSDILEAIQTSGEQLDIYELGAGDGRKTIEFLKQVNGYPYRYYPIDISANALEVLEKNVVQAIPDVVMQSRQGDYFEILRSLAGKGKKLVLFLGSNMGNMADEDAAQFMQSLSEVLDEGDHVLIGLDLKKDKAIVLPAYNDKSGYTRDFNLNLLRRINREMEADFDLGAFKHVPEYDENQGIALSYLQSAEDQVVHLKSIEVCIPFQQGELIHTEISRKYDRTKLEQILQGSKLEIVRIFTDSRNYFSDFLLRKK